MQGMPGTALGGTLENCLELILRQRYSTRADAEADLFDYIEPFYNRRRRHSTLGYASPEKFLKDWFSTQHEQELAA
jgi:putative transposase